MIHLNNWNEITALSISAICFISFLIQTYYYVFVYRKISYKSSKKKLIQQKKQPISIVISAKNEEEYLKSNLPLILTQNYEPGYEVIVVNDNSSDDTETLLSILSLKYPRLRTTFVHKEERFYNGNKLAITIGIKAAKYERIVFIEPSCRPSGVDWLNELSEFESEGRDILIGYSTYEMDDKDKFHRKLRYYAFRDGLNYLGKAIRGSAFMAYRKNMSITKQLFFKGKGYARRTDITFGEDDLLVQDNATKHNTAACIGAKTITISDYPTKEEWSHHYRHYKHGRRHYKTSVKLFLLMEPLSRVLLFLSVVSSLLFYNLIFTSISFGLLLIRWIYQPLIFKHSAKQIGEIHITWTSFKLDILYMFSDLGRAISNFLRKRSS